MQTETIQAPAGGAVSSVNGEFYEGGEFMPITGEFCGAKRDAKKKADKFTGNWAEIAVSRMGSVMVRIAGQWRYKALARYSTNEEATAFAVEVVRIRAEKNLAQGIQAHPTVIEQIS